MKKKNGSIIGILFIAFSSMILTGCSLLEEGRKQYLADKEICMMDAKNIAKFTYKDESYTILQDTIDDSELGTWVGYIHKLVVFDANEHVILQQEIEETTLHTLLEIAETKPEAEYIIPFLNVYTNPTNSTKELIVDVDASFHRAILSDMVTPSEEIFRPTQKKSSLNESFAVNPKDCTQLLSGDKVYQVTDETIPRDKVENYLDILAKTVTFDADSKQELTRSELSKIDWSGNGISKQNRERWTYETIYTISGIDPKEAVAVEVNSNYRIAKCQSTSSPQL